MRDGPDAEDDLGPGAVGALRRPVRRGGGDHRGPQGDRQAPRARGGQAQRGEAEERQGKTY